MDLAGSFHGQIHANCVERGGAGVLLLGTPGSGKSDLTLRLLEHGFSLVADDRVDIANGVARAPAELAGLLEVRGLGILRMRYTEWAVVALAIELGAPSERLPSPRRHAALNVPLVQVDPHPASAASRVALALCCTLGQAEQVAGAFKA
jgi:HPr kinase/phosphorylase